MKFRSSFVSNSSSASFIVNLKIPKKDLYNFLTNNVEKHFSCYDLKEELNRRILHFEKQQESYLERKKASEESGELEKFFGIDWSHMLQKLKDLLSEVTDLYEKIKIEEDLIKSEQYKLDYIRVASSVNHLSFWPLFDGDDNDTWKFTTYVTMYNDLDDVPEAMRDIIVACNFSGVKVKCEVDED